MNKWIRSHAVSLTLLPVLFLMLIIFYFSAQPAESSDETSGFFVARILRIVFPNFDSQSQVRQTEIEHSVSFLVRKAAHMTEYAFLGLALILHVRTIGLRKQIQRPRLLAFLIGVLYAASDELHQVFVPGRSGEMKDVLLDSMGVLLGLILFSWHKILRAKRLPRL